jgi:hypothetical protein
MGSALTNFITVPIGPKYAAINTKLKSIFIDFLRNDMRYELSRLPRIWIPSGTENLFFAAASIPALVPTQPFLWVLMALCPGIGE